MQPETTTEQNLLSMKTALASELKRKIDEIDAEMERYKSEFKEVTGDLMKILESLSIDSVKMHGFNFFIEEKMSVKTPATLEDKLKLFEYLKSKNLFEEMVSVHSQTLNSFYKSEAEEAAQNGVLMFQMPGIEEPKPYKNLKMRRI